MKAELLEWVMTITIQSSGSPRNFEQPLFEMYNDVAIGLINHINGTEKMEKSTMIHFLQAIENNQYTFDETIPGLTEKIKNWLEVHVVPEPNHNSMVGKGGHRKSRHRKSRHRKSRNRKTCKSQKRRFK